MLVLYRTIMAWEFYVSILGFGVLFLVHYASINKIPFHSLGMLGILPDRWCRNQIKKRSQEIFLCKPHCVWSPRSASNLIWTNENFMSWKIAPMSIINSVRLSSALEMLRDWDTFPNLGSGVTQNILDRRWNSSSLIIISWGPNSVFGKAEDYTFFSVKELKT